MSPEPSPSKDIPETHSAPALNSPLNTNFSEALHNSSKEPPCVLISAGAIRDNAALLRSEIGDSRLFADISCDAYGHGVGLVSTSVFGPAAAGERSLIDGFFGNDEGSYWMLNNRVLPVHLHTSFAATSFGKDTRRAWVADFAVKNWPVTVGSKNHLRIFQRDAHDLATTVPVRLELDAQIASCATTAAFRELMEPFPDLRLGVLAIRRLRNTAHTTLIAGGLERLSKVVKEYNQQCDDPSAHLSLEIPRVDPAFRGAYSKNAIVCSGPELYGIVEERSRLDSTELQPAMRVISSVEKLFYLEKGQRWVFSNRSIKKFTAIAMISAGSNHGYSKRGGHKLSIAIGGKNYPVFGTPAGTCIGVDVTNLPEVQKGDQAVILGDNRFGRNGPLLLADRKRAKWSVMTQSFGQRAGDSRKPVENFEESDRALSLHWNGNRGPRQDDGL